MKKAIIILALLILPTQVCSQYEPPIEFTEPLETPHFTIYYREDHAIIAQEIAEIAEDMYEDATSFMGYSPQDTIEICIHPSCFTFARFVNASDATGFDIHCGCPFSTESLGMNPLERKQLVATGLSSVLFLRMVGVGESTLSSQLWLEMGITAYYSLKGDNTTALAAVSLLKEHDSLPTSFDEITFENYANFVHPLSFTIVQYMIHEYGEENFHTFLGTLREWDQTKTSTENVNNALGKAFGVTREEVEQGWLSYIETFSISETECDAVQITDLGMFAVPCSWQDTILYTAHFKPTEWSKNLDIFAIDTGGNIVQLTDDLAPDFDPRFSPDGARIAFTSLRDEYANIYCMDADGSNVQQLTSEKSMDYMGSWLPDGSKIAFTSARSGNYDIYCMNADGSNVQQVTTYKGEDGWPVFSPDGQKIVFVSDRSGSYDLYTMNTDGTDVQQLTSTPEHENFPQYSPDGKKIAFVAHGTGGAEICVMNSDGTGRESVLSQPVIYMGEKIVPSLIGYPVWSPDGTEIAFIMGTEIFTIPFGQGFRGDLLLALLPLLVIIVIVLWKRGKQKQKE